MSDVESSRLRAVSAARPALVRTMLALVLLAGATGCTHHDKPSTPSAKPSPPPSSSAAPAPVSAPMQVRVTRVLGRLPQRAQPALEANVGRTIGAYLDDAFLGGHYPRSDFSDAFRSFTKGAAGEARGDRTLLTNASYGASTTAVRATRRSAYLSVLAPNEVAAGVTARVDVTLRVERGNQAAERVHLTGRLLLTRDPHNDWVIFGYDLARSDTPAGGGS